MTLLTKKELAAKMKVSPRTIANLVKNGYLKAERTNPLIFDITNPTNSSKIGKKSDGNKFL